MVDKEGVVKDYCSFDKRKSKKGAIEHMGDNLTGEGNGDDE